MADIDITVDNHDLKAAIDLLGDLSGEFINTVNTMQREVKKIERAGKASSDIIGAAFDEVTKDLNKVDDVWTRVVNNTLKENKVLERDLTKGFANISVSAKQFYDTLYKGNLSNLSAKDSVLADILREEEAAIEESNRALREKEALIIKLESKFDPLAAAVRKHAQEERMLEQAVENNIIDIYRYAQELDRLDAELDAFSQGVYVAGSRFNQFGEVSRFAGKNMNRVGMYAQQMGYQFGDMAVQIQSGTNVGVAFSQQMAQLAGLIPGVAGAITTFAAIGIGLLIQNLTRAKKEAEETYVGLDSISELTPVFQAAGNAFRTSFINAITDVRSRFGDFVADILKFRMDALKENLEAQFDGLTPSQSVSFSMIAGGNPMMAAQAVQGQIANSNTVLLVQTELRNVLADNVATVEQMEQAFADAFNRIKTIPGVTQEILDRVLEIGEEQGVNGRILDSVIEGERARLELLRAGAQARVAYNQRLAESHQYMLDEVANLSQQIILQAMINQHGQDSIQVLDEIKRQELLRYEASLQQQGLQANEVRTLVAIKEQLIDAEQALARQRIQAEAIRDLFMRIAGTDIASGIRAAESAAQGLLGRLQASLSVMSRIGRVGLSNEALAAENAALAAGASPEMARVERQVVEFIQEANATEGTPSGYYDVISRAFQVAAHRAGLIQGVNLEADNQRMIDAWNEANDPSSGGGSGSKTSALETIMREIEQRRRLIGVSEENRRLIEEIIRVENQLGEERENVTDAQIEQLARASLAVEESLRKQEEAEQRHKEMVDSVANHIDNAMMAVVNGTASIEDSFKSLMRNLISDIYQQAVSQPLSKSLSSFLVGLFAANGHAFVGGRVQAFADGGVVNSPTLFNYSGGTGLMGEAGPEAILPLSRGSDGKLGVKMEGGKSSGSINITQVFNISANGDETVKRIIQSESKNIISATKAAVIDAKQRGQRGF